MYQGGYRAVVPRYEAFLCREAKAHVSHPFQEFRGVLAARVGKQDLAAGGEKGGN